MPYDQLVTGQHVSAQLKSRAKELRREMTPSERKLWQRLRANRLDGYHFRRQQIIGGYIADFYCHAVGLVVEVDGGIHLEQEGYDHERNQFMVGLGLTVLRFFNTDVDSEIDSVLGVILEACQEGRGGK